MASKVLAACKHHAAVAESGALKELALGRFVCLAAVRSDAVRGAAAVELRRGFRAALWGAVSTGWVIFL